MTEQKEQAPDQEIKFKSYRKQRRREKDIDRGLNKLTIGEVLRRSEQEPEGDTYANLLNEKDLHTQAAGIIRRDLKKQEARSKT